MKGRTAAIVAGVLVVGLVIGFAASAMAGDDQAAAAGTNRLISVSSTATVNEAPDEAVVNLAVRSEDVDSAAAFAQNAQEMAAVLDALKAAGIAEKDLRTLDVGLQQRTVGRGTSDEHQVFVASNSVQVTVHDLDTVGSVIDAAVKAGADSVNDIRFQVSDEDQVRSDALAQAVQGAREKADALAQAAGAQVVRVRSIDEGSVRLPVYRQAYDLAALPSAMTPVVAPDSLEASVTVQVVWEIG